MDEFNHQPFNDFLLLISADNPERPYYLLSASIVVFFILSAFFALLTFGLRWRNNRHDAHWKTLNAMWDTDILHVMSGEMSDEEFRKKIPRRNELDFIKYLTPYAWRLAGSDLTTLSRLAFPYLHHVLKKLSHPNPEIRAWAVNALSLFGMPKYTPAVMQHLGDPSSVVAMSAANALLKQRKVDYIAPVLNYFHRFDHWNLASLTNLITHCGPESIPILEDILLDQAKPVRTRVVAAESLRVLNDYKIADQVAQNLEDETDQELIAASLRLLSFIGRSAHREIVNRLCQSSNDVIRVNAMRTLRSIGVHDDIPVFRQGVMDKSPWVAVQSAYGLHELGDDDFLIALINKGHSRAHLAKQVLAEARAT